MKKKNILVLLSLIAFAGSLIAQQIPNHNFENWTGENPESWDTSNENIMGISQFTTVTAETTDPYEGVNSAKVRTVTNNIMLAGDVTIPGVLTLGDFILDTENETASIEGGIEFPHRPKKLKGYYKSFPTGTDQPMIGVGFSKWNEETLQADTLAFGIIYFSEETTTWTEFEIEFEWASNDIPDTCNIIIASSDLMSEAEFSTDSEIWTDSLFFEYPEPRDIITVAPIDPISVEQGTLFNELSLPEEIGVLLDDDSGAMLDIIWDDTNYPVDGDLPGTYTLTADIILIDSINNPSDYVAEIDITIEALVEDLDITTVESFDPITVEYETIFEELPLPTQIEATLEDASTEMLDIIWDEGSYPINGDIPGEYNLIGDIQLVDGIINPLELEAEISVTIDDYVSIIDLKATEVSIYPNPSSDIITIETSQIQSITIVDVQGRTVKHIKHNGNTIRTDVSDLKKGLYFVQVQTANEKHMAKLIIN